MCEPSAATFSRLPGRLKTALFARKASETSRCAGRSRPWVTGRRSRSSNTANLKNGLKPQQLRRFSAQPVRAVGDDEINPPAAALAAHQPLMPFKDGHLGAVALRHLGRVRLDLVAAIETPHDGARPGRALCAEVRCHSMRRVVTRSTANTTCSGGYEALPETLQARQVYPSDMAAFSHLPAPQFLCLGGVEDNFQTIRRCLCRTS